MVDLSSKSRPTRSPWETPNPSRVAKITAASLIPAGVTIALTILFGIDPAIALTLIFVPLQIVFAIAVGRNVAGRKGQGDAVLMFTSVFFTVLVAVLLVSLLWSIVSQGFAAMSWHFIYQNNVYIDPTTSLEFGGVGHAIVGTLLIVGLTTIVTVPLGILIAVYLIETRDKGRSSVRTLVQAMSGLPSVVSGLFVYSMLIVSGVTSYAGWAGSLALLPLMLPTVARTAEEALRLVPVEIRNGALALGSPSFRAFWQVTLPAARSGIITAVILGVARIIGETAPLLLTTFAAKNTNFNVFNGPISSLPTYLYQFVSNGYDTSTQRAWGAALVIMILVAILFTATRIIAGDRKRTKKKA
jgi:phosphate transport system permease protein